MEEFYLCFESGAISFLLPLAQVARILPAFRETCGEIEFEGRQVKVIQFHACLFDGGAAEHLILFKALEVPYALSVERVTGVEEFSSSDFKELPPEALGSRNRFLKAAVKKKYSGTWAYLLDALELLNMERQD